MVAPLSDAERDAGNRKVKLGILLIVAVSPPLIALQMDPSLLELIAALGVGVGLGLLVVWYLSRLGSEFTRSSAGRSRRKRR